MWLEVDSEVSDTQEAIMNRLEEIKLIVVSLIEVERIILCLIIGFEDLTLSDKVVTSIIDHCKVDSVLLELCLGITQNERKERKIQTSPWIHLFVFQHLFPWMKKLTLKYSDLAWTLKGGYSKVPEINNCDLIDDEIPKYNHLSDLF